MLIKFTKSGDVLPVTLGDDTVKQTIIIEQIGGTAIVQVEALAGGANPALFPRGNVGGELVFTISKTEADYKTTFTKLKAEYARLNQQGTLVLSESTVNLTFANAVLKGLQRLFDAQASGSHMKLRYTFAITTIL